MYSMVSDWLSAFYHSQNQSESDPTDIVADDVILKIKVCGVVWTLSFIWIRYLFVVIAIIRGVNSSLLSVFLKVSEASYSAQPILIEHFMENNKNKHTWNIWLI